MFTRAMVVAQPRSRLNPCSDEDVCKRLLLAFEAAVDCPSEDRMSALHASVRDFAATTRYRALPPERALATLKTLLTGHGQLVWVPSLDIACDMATTDTFVYAQLFHWFLASYYGEYDD